ncbi:MAG TPA: hypothetical protein VL285_17745, partial [Bryobacteraceae bacterium]|nr:hypothetical protein [Bryobacteraceae bacterium]
VYSHPSRSAVYSLTPRTATVHEIDPVSCVLRRKVRLGLSAISMRPAPDGRSLWILSREERELVQLGLDDFKAGVRVKLPAAPEDFDLATGRAAVSFPAAGTFAVVGLDSGRVERVAESGPGAQTVRFFHGGRQLLCGNRGNRTVTIFDVEKGRLVSRLPVAVTPENFCFKAANDGELYVTGAGGDALVVIYPYQAEVYETRLVGRSPGAMAVSGSPQYLFVANTESDNVTVMNIQTGRTVVVSVGAEPRHIAVTPDDQYALTLNRRSGDMAVIRIPAFANKDRAKTAPTPLFTMIPVGAKPVSAAIRRV